VPLGVAPGDERPRQGERLEERRVARRGAVMATVTECSLPCKDGDDLVTLEKNCGYSFGTPSPSFLPRVWRAALRGRGAPACGLALGRARPGHVWLWWGVHHARWQLQMINLTAVPVQPPGRR